MSLKTGFRTLKKYKIPTAKHGFAKRVDEAAKLAKKIGYPVALKADAPSILHKTDKGVVSYNIEDEKELRREWKKIKKAVGRKKLNGILVQKNLDGIEIIIGGKHDPQFGETVLFGLGGIFVEVFQDVAMRVTPFTKREAQDMVKEIKGYKILAGVRGGKPVKISAIVDSIMKVQRMMEKENIRELDINPLFADEKGVKAVDVRIIK